MGPGVEQCTSYREVNSPGPYTFDEPIKRGGRIKCYESVHLVESELNQHDARKRQAFLQLTYSHLNLLL